MESLDSFEKLLIVMFLTILIMGSIAGFGLYMVL